MAEGTLQLTQWSCVATPPGLYSHPGDLHHSSLDWIPANVPGTAAGAMREAGRWSWDDSHDFDSEDWWFRCNFPAEPGARPRVLDFGGLATIADAWLNGHHILSSTNMHRAHHVEVGDRLSEENELVVRCAALGPVLSLRRPRPRWKTGLVAHQNLRWFRTTLLGRMPGWMPPAPPVGPWRPVTLRAQPRVEVACVRLRAVCDGTERRVEIVAEVTAHGLDLVDVVLEVDGHRAALGLRGGPDFTVVTGNVSVPGARLWWPWTHGDQPLYDVRLECGTTEGDHVVHLGRTGFRTISFGSASEPELSVNGEPIFCRGAGWTPPDVVGLGAGLGDVRSALEQVRGAGFNMVRTVANTLYPSHELYDICDELGIMVWQDLLFANMDYPVEDQGFRHEVTEELTGVLAGLSGRPCVVAVCGGNEVAQQAAMMGQSLGPCASLYDDVIPGLVAIHLPDTPYWAHSPTGGTHPFTVDVGLAHYYGVGAYRRPLADARLAAVRFAPECLGISHVPAVETVDELRARGVAVHDSAWKRRVPRDAGASWDSEDTRDHYVSELYGVDPTVVRRSDVDRYLDLGRAASAEVLARTFTEWRRPDSTCRGALMLMLRDLCDGAGMGLIDAKGRPKSPYHPLRRVLSPAALLLCDEGLNGLDIWLLNEGQDPIDGTLVVRALSDESTTAKSETGVRMTPRSSRLFHAEELLGSFMDVTYAYRFGPPAVSAVAVHWYADDGGLISRGVYHPPAGPLERSDVGLQGRAWRISDRSYQLEVSARRSARSVMIDAPGCRLSDDCFDIESGGSVQLEAETPGRLRARVRAINGFGAVPIIVEDRQHGA
jgi:beta-mannosidase